MEKVAMIVLYQYLPTWFSVIYSTIKVIQIRKKLDGIDHETKKQLKLDRLFYIPVIFSVCYIYGSFYRLYNLISNSRSVLGDEIMDTSICLHGIFNIFFYGMDKDTLN